MFNRVALQEIVDIGVLQEIQDLFCEITKMAAVIVDFKGNPITMESSFTKFCTKFREDDQCRQVCYKSDAHAGVEAASNGESYIYHCHMGLVDISIPIIFHDQLLATMLAGQVKVEDECFPQLIRSVPQLVNERMKDPELKSYYDEIPVLKSEEVKRAANIMHIIVNFIVEKAFGQLIQEELNEKNVKLIQEMKARMEIEKHLRDSEMQLLKSQVNPHFLFNVLNTINSLAMIEDAPKTSEMIYSLSEMLRYSLKNGVNNLVTLEQEIDYAMKYVNIQKIRLGDKLKYKVDVPEKFMNVKLPFMIVQPLIANAITHGIFEKGNDGVVSLNCYEDKDHVYITVADNGVGMEKEKISKILNGECKGESSTGIGLINTHKRLIHHFGKEYTPIIESVVGKGTKVIIKVPK